MESNNTFQVKKISEPISLKIKRNWIYLKMETKKIITKIMVIMAIIIVALLYFRGYEITIAIMEAIVNPQDMRVYVTIPAEVKKPMLESGARLQERVEQDKEKEIQKEYKDVSEAEKAIAVKTAKAASDASGVIREVTAYNSKKEQTDNTPCYAEGSKNNLCKLYRERGMNICASNRFPFGTELKIDNFGNCYVLDRMNDRYAEGVDIFFDKDVPRAKNLGRQKLMVWVVGYHDDMVAMEPGQKPRS